MVGAKLIIHMYMRKKKKTQNTVILGLPVGPAPRNFLCASPERHKPQTDSSVSNQPSVTSQSH